MEESSRARIRAIKSRVIAMLEERRALDDASSTVSPSKFWSDVCSHFDYMLGLPEEYFVKLRLHTYHLTGDIYQTYLFGDAQYFRSTNKVDVLADGVPSTYVLNEPEGGIGFRYDDGRYLSSDILRFQRVVNTLYRYGILPQLSTLSGRRARILEIGAGYGGLAHHISNICKNTTYVVVDLPETLLFASSYLSLLNPHKRVYLYAREDFDELMKPGATESYDFVLIPNYRLNSLSRIGFDLVINVDSLQEMRTSQAETYLEFICRTCTGEFYSWNKDRNPHNPDLSDLSDLLRRRFDVREIPEPNVGTPVPKLLSKARLRRIVKRIAILTGLLDRTVLGSRDPPAREYLCRPFGPHGQS